jgi:hypothetical protein
LVLLKWRGLLKGLNSRLPHSRNDRLVVTLLFGGNYRCYFA